VSVIGPFLLALAVFAAGGAAGRPVVRAVSARLPDRQKAKVLAAGAKAAPAVTRARQAAASAARNARGRIPVQPAPRLPARGAQAVPRPAAQAAGSTVVQFRKPAPAPAQAAAQAPPRKDPAPMPAGDSLTPGGAGADLFAAIQTVIAHGAAGNVQAKQRALAQLAEACGYVHDALAGFALRLAEPDQHYPASIWEPVGVAAGHAQAAALAIGDGLSALQMVLSMPVGEVAGSGHQIPHHDQVNSGA
jgi:hypothetical protein